ncbi:MAG: SLBB domain-containing protein [Nitrospira sp.]|nr:MAG: SLBB domain-containing protein [Nitrospira sp.]
MRISMHKSVKWSLLCLSVGVMAMPGCRNPAQSSLPPSAISPAAQSLPPMPKGDVYADEAVPTAETPIESGDTLDIVIRRGAGEEKFMSVVRENGMIGASFLEVAVGGLTAQQAEARIQEQVIPYMRNPRVQVVLKKKSLKIKRVFVFGDVRKPGAVPMPRDMTVLQALAAVENYNETALLEEIRIVRGSLDRPYIVTADLARTFTYGDLSRNVALEENDVIFVPREHLGDASEAAKKIMPIIQVAIAPFYPAYLIPAFFPTATLR